MWAQLHLGIDLFDKGSVQGLSEFDGAAVVVPVEDVDVVALRWRVGRTILQRIGDPPSVLRAARCPY